MLVNWQKILKYKDMNILDENIFYILSYFFDDFIFDSFDKDGNIIAITKGTGKKVIINVNDTSYKYNFEENNKKYRLNKSGSLNIIKRFYKDGEDFETAFLVKSSINEKKFYPGRSDYELTKENVRYSYDEYEGDIYGEVIAHVNRFYLFPHKKKVSLKPDISVGVVVSSYNNEKVIYKTKLLEDTVYHYDQMQLNVITPITAIAHDTILKMYEDAEYSLHTKKDVYRYNKIGF